MNADSGKNKTNTTVLFLIQNEKMPSSRIRIMNLLPELRKEGFEVEMDTYPKNILQRINLYGKCRQFDIVYLQRRLLSIIDAAVLRKNAKKLIFDFDDAIYYRHDRHDTLESQSRYIKFKYLSRTADLVIAGNRILADYAKQFNDNVVILPSAVETRNIAIKNHGISSDTTIIGWVGVGSNLHHLSMLSAVFQRLASIHKIQVRIVSSSGIEIPGVDVKLVPWRLEKQEEEIAAFDIGVMPLPDNKLAGGKCGYKAIQYMASAVPSVVSDVGVNRDIVGHGREGFVVQTLEGFFEALRVLIENRALREEMGINARKKVENQFSIQAVAKEFANILHRCGN